MKQWSSVYEIKSFQAPLYLAVIFIEVGASADKYIVFVLTLGYKENEQIRLTRRMCAVLGKKLLITTVE